VEDVVYLPRGRYLQLVGHGGYFSDYPEGSVSLLGIIWGCRMGRLMFFFLPTRPFLTDFRIP